MPIRVLFTCGREPTYPRNSFIQAAFAHSFQVIPVTDSSHSLPLRYARLALKLLQARRLAFDLIFVGFLGQPLVPFIRRLTPQPVLFDAFLSVYDTLCFDRRRFSPGSLPGKSAFRLDQTSCSLADRVILDTQAHADYFHQMFGVPQEKLRSLFVGCDENLFYPQSQDHTTLARSGEARQVLFYGSYLPLQGVDIIVRAAALLQDSPGIHFRLIGRGMEWERVRQLAHELDLHNVEFLPPVPLADLPAVISQADVCLGGHFGRSEKAGRVIAGKTFQCLAMGKPTIVSDNPANRELLTHGVDAWLCPMDDPVALAASIRGLLQDAALRVELGHNARRTFLARASLQALTPEICKMVEELIKSGRPGK